MTDGGDHLLRALLENYNTSKFLNINLVDKACIHGVAAE